MDKYFDLGHAEPIQIFCHGETSSRSILSPHACSLRRFKFNHKDQGCFDASAKSNSGISLNNTLFVGPTVHSTLLDVLLRFQFHQIALVADVSKMYQAIKLTEPDGDLHRFVWRANPQKTLQNYRMTRVTFGVAASSIGANMSINKMPWILLMSFLYQLKLSTNHFMYMIV